MQASCVEILNVLKDVHFPLAKEELIQQAIKHGASYQVLEYIKNIPEKEYASTNDVVKELCGMRFR